MFTLLLLLISMFTCLAMALASYQMLAEVYQLLLPSVIHSMCILLYSKFYLIIVLFSWQHQNARQSHSRLNR